MSSGHAAQPPDTAATPSESPAAEAAPPPAVPRQSAPPDSGPPRPGRHIGRVRSHRGWTWLIAAAAAAFCVALVLGAMRLYVDTGDVTDSPEHTVDAFLAALLDQRDATAAADWLCAEKADRDLGEAVAQMSFTDGPGEFAWGEVNETHRSVGAATVSAEIRVGGDDAFSDPTTWVFSLVAEEGEPQWLICGIAAE